MAMISVRLPDDERYIIEAYCEENDITMSQVIRRAIREFLRSEGIEV